jgi:glycosyltransferase involved in cell wall biosynthesis
MRVLYLTQNPNRASTTVPTEGWLRLLRPRGLEPVLASSQSGAFQRWAAEHQIPSYDLPLPFPDRRRPWIFGAALASLVRIARRHRIELIHANEQDVYPIAQYAGRILGVPRVVSVHFTMERGFCQWAFSGRRAPDRMYFVSRSNQEACRQALDGVVIESRWRVLRNGLDLAEFVPDLARRQRARHRFGIGEGLVIGVACALRPRKQLEHLFRAAAAVTRPVHVFVAGGPVPGDETYAAQLLADARTLLGERLHLLGHLDELRDFYNGLDLFVNTSREEACSISVIESLSCGCPVVGYASRSVDEQVLPDGGEIVPQDDHRALAAAIDRWLASPATLAAGRAGARRQAEALFDIQTLAQDLWADYESIVSAERPATVRA